MAKKSKSKISESQIAEILDILDSGDVEKTLTFFHDMPEEERRQYAKPIQKFCRERQSMRSGLTVRTLNETSIEEIRQMMQDSDNAFQHWQNIAKAVWRALLATSTPNEIEKCKRQRNGFSFFQPGHTENSLYEVLNNRKPDWLESFLLDEFEKSPNRGETWDKYRTFYHQGSVGRLLSPAAICGLYTYYQWHNSGTRDKPIRPTPDYFRNDPELLEREIWLLFELTLPELRSWSPPGMRNKWNETLSMLAEEGRLDRSRLLDAILDGIGRNHLEWQEKWLIELHDHFKPTAEEQLERTGKYVAILDSQRFTTAHFALERILPFLKSNRIESHHIETILKAIFPLLLDKSKGRIKKLLSALETILKNAPAIQSKVFPVLLEAVTHENKDVQESSARILLKHADLKNDDVAASMQKILPTLAPSVRAMFPASLESVPAPSPSPIASVDVTIPKELPEKYLNLASIHEVQDALKTGRDFLPPTKFSGMDIPRLKSDEYLQPPQNVEELSELVINTVMRPLFTPLYEWMVDGIARFSDINEEIRRRLGSVRESVCMYEKVWPWLSIVRCLLGTRSEVHGIPCFIDEDGYQLASIPRDRFQESCNNTTYHFWTCYLDGVIQHLLCYGAYQPLASPTHLGHWIDPIRFVERLIGNQKTLHQHDIFDKILALFRLAPDHRDDALKMLDTAKLPENTYVEAVRYALGAEHVTILSADDRETMPIWAAASRARDPFGSDEFVQSYFPGLGFGTARPVRYDNILVRDVFRLDTGLVQQGYFTDFAEEFSPMENQLLYPSILAYRSISPEFHWFRTVFNLWPTNPVPGCLHAVLQLAEGMDSRSFDEGKAGYLECLLDPDLPFDLEAATLLLLGLLCVAPTTQTLAVDAWIAVIQDGRFDEDKLIDAARQLLPFAEKVDFSKRGVLSHSPQRLHGGTVEDYRLVPSRWVKCFTTIANESPLHAQYVRKIIERMIPDVSAKDTGAFLELLHELCLESSETIETPETRKFLADLKGGGKASKAAKKLLDLQPNEVLRKKRRRLAAQQSLQGRIERVKRWMDAELPIPTTK